jgi:hypothetical protein
MHPSSSTAQTANEESLDASKQLYQTANEESLDASKQLYQSAAIIIISKI